MLSSIYKNITAYNFVVKSNKVAQKYILFESDDWGALRGNSISINKSLKKNGINTSNCHYALYDKLASKRDLECLFETLSFFKDIEDKHPTITANTIVANPDFVKIRASDYTKYSYEKFTKTIEDREGKDVLVTWEKGIESSLFHPQLHGREHLNISRWMKDLNDKVPSTHEAFNHDICAISAHIVKDRKWSYLAAFDTQVNDYKVDFNIVLAEALSIFEEIFNFKSETFIAPNYVWTAELEDILANNNVNTIQGALKQIIPTSDHFKKKYKRRYIRTNKNITSLVRNCNFEPSSNLEIDWVNTCLADINYAFNHKLPAIINTHRVNYIGSLDIKNSDRNLKMLSQLLKSILQKWPDVRFVNSTELSSIIKEKQT